MVPPADGAAPAEVVVEMEVPSGCVMVVVVDISGVTVVRKFLTRLHVIKSVTVYRLSRCNL